MAPKTERIPELEKRSRPTVGGYYWYELRGGWEIVHVNRDCQYVKRFYGAEMSITECRGKFHGPLTPEKERSY